jgi:hypothetical protein
MEINFLDVNKTNQNPYENFDYKSYENENETSQKYWEQENLSQNQNKKQTKKKKVSFDDILSNMNLVVNDKGVLQYMSPIISTNEENLQQQYPQQYTQQQQYPQQQQYHQKQNEPLDPSVKHSYIFNKYFKEYKDANSPKQQVKVPKTKEEYFKMVAEERLRQIEERKRISQIKSKKLMFTTNYDNIANINSENRNIKASKNNLRRMSFY